MSNNLPENLRRLDKERAQLQKDIRGIRMRISHIEKNEPYQKKEYKELMSLLKTFSDLLLKNESLTHNILQDITIKKKLLEAQAARFTLIALREIEAETESSEFDEQYDAWYTAAIERSKQKVLEESEGIINDQQV